MHFSTYKQSTLSGPRTYEHDACDHEDTSTCSFTSLLRDLFFGYSPSSRRAHLPRSTYHMVPLHAIARRTSKNYKGD
jgi:hypothetical protein